ncbi:MAG: NAD(P)H-dependent oxidoreductase [Actinomycetota bacterium]
MRVLAIPATNSRQGLNRQLIGYAGRLLEERLGPDLELEVVDINDYEMPIYSTEREREHGIPEPAKELFAKFGDAEVLVFSFAEYNGSYTAAWKNIHDWMSRIDAAIYQNKKVAMFAATPGPRSGAGVLGSATMAAPFFGAELIGSLGIGRFRENFDPDQGAISDPELRTQFIEILDSLIA